MTDLFHRFARNRLAAAGLVVIGLYVVGAIAAPLIAPDDPLRYQLDAQGHAQQWLSPSITHWCGTDRSARDVFSRLVYGSRLSLCVAGGAVAFAFLIGTTMGLVAGYFGGWVDMTISRLMDVMFSLPAIVLALVVLAVLGPGLLNIALAIGIVYTPIFARVGRGAVLHVKGQPYVEAARAAGVGHGRVMVRHILPNIAAPMIVQTTLSLAFAILTEAAISFLGLSGQTDAPSWGLMLRQGKDAMIVGVWWTAFFPGLAITLAVLSFNLVGDGLQDALDPRGDGA